MDLEEIAYSDGSLAQYNGYGLRHNPHKRFTNEWEQWRIGWKDNSVDDKYYKNIDKIRRKSRILLKNK